MATLAPTSTPGFGEILGVIDFGVCVAYFPTPDPGVPDVSAGFEDRVSPNMPAIGDMDGALKIPPPPKSVPGHGVFGTENPAPLPAPMPPAPGVDANIPDIYRFLVSGPARRFANLGRLAARGSADVLRIPRRMAVPPAK